MHPALRVAPRLEDKLERLGQAAVFDLSCACGEGPARTKGIDDRWIYPAALPSGRRVPVLKVLQEGGCERDCAYCAQRLGGAKGAGLSFGPDELARLFFMLYEQQRVHGLFLSSAIRRGPVASMDRMLATAEILRGRLHYRGYLHLKILPGCAADQIERAMQLATRVSVNMEAPGRRHLQRLAPSKAWGPQILAALRQVAQAQAAGRFRKSGQTTQLVVGAAEESDEEIARAATWLYRELGLARVYYSAFQPLAGTPLAERPATPTLREHRLYQLDFLLRQYGFAPDEITFDVGGRLPLAIDPKTAWAHQHPERFPLELNTAAYAELVRVPGIGPRSAQRLIACRREGPIRTREALRACGANWRVAAPYLLLDGRRAAPPRQLELFSTATSELPAMH